MLNSRPVQCRRIASSINSIVNLTENHEGNREILDRLNVYSLDLASMANIASVRNPSAFSQIDQNIRAIHSLLTGITGSLDTRDKSDLTNKTFRLIDELFVDMWGLGVDDQLEREHETRLKGADMMAPQQKQAGQIQLIGGRPGGGNGQSRR